MSLSMEALWSRSIFLFHLHSSAISYQPPIYFYFLFSFFISSSFIHPPTSALFSIVPWQEGSIHGLLFILFSSNLHEGLASRALEIETELLQAVKHVWIFQRRGAECRKTNFESRKQFENLYVVYLRKPSQPRHPPCNTVSFTAAIPKLWVVERHVRSSNMYN